MVSKRESRVRNGFTAGLAAALALAGCGKPAPELHVTGGYVRLPAVPGRPAAAYFTLHGGERDARLLSISSAVAIRTEMHESTTRGGIASMAPIDTLAVPARAALPFRPGGRHAMLFQMDPSIKPGSGVPLLFSFGDGTRIPYTAPALAAGAPAPQ